MGKFPAGGHLDNIFIVDDGQLCDSNGNRFQFDKHDTKFDNTLRYEGIAHVGDRHIFIRRFNMQFL